MTLTNGKKIEQICEKGQSIKEISLSEVAESKLGSLDSLTTQPDFSEGQPKCLDSRHKELEEEVSKLQEKLAKKPSSTDEIAKIRKRASKFKKQAAEAKETVENLQRTLKEVQIQYDDEVRKNLCAICFEKSRDVVLLPCKMNL